MGGALVHQQFYKQEEYLAFAEMAEEKHEYENGEIFAMSGGSYSHGLIAGNVVRRLQELLDDRNCTAVGSDVKVEIAEYSSFVYPDAMVICGPVALAENRRDVIKNPILVIEILSESTELYDRGRKFKKYQSLPSFQEYVLISQTEPLVETFFRQDHQHWLYTVTEGIDAVVSFQSLQHEIFLRAIYQKVEFSL